MVDNNKKGPVRPPILDAEAKKPSSAADRSTPSTSKPTVKPATATPSAAKSATKKPIDPPKSTPDRNKNEGGGIGGLITTIIVSAALGMAGSAGLAYFKVFPFDQWAAQSDLTPEIAKLQKRIFDLENEQPDLSSFATKQGLNAVQAEVEDIDVAQLKQAITKFESQLASIDAPADPAATIDLAPIQTALKGLTQDVANLKEQQAQLAVPSAANSEPAGQQPSAPQIDLTPVKDQLAAQSDSLSTLDAELASQKQTLANVQNQLAQVETELQKVEQDQSARQAANTALAAARLPILMSEIDANIKAGDPFARSIKELGSILGTTPSSPVMQVAETGLTPASVLTSQFNSLRPQLLAARPSLPDDAPWQDKLFGAIKNAVNLRPVDGQQDDPLSLIDQIDAALNAGKLHKAQTLIEKLPPPMQKNVAPISATIGHHILIEQWRVETRAALLNQNAPTRQDEGEAQ